MPYKPTTARGTESVSREHKEHQQEIAVVLSPDNPPANTYNLESDATYEFAIESPYAWVYGPNSNQNRRSVSKALYEQASEDSVSSAETGDQQTFDHKGTTPEG